MNRILLCVLFCVSAASVLLALPEASIGYQGHLKIVTDPTGKETLGQPIELRFTLYQSETGGSPLWGRAVSVTPDVDGNFAVVLSDAEGSALVEDAPGLDILFGKAEVSESTFWLTFSAGREESRELAPRQAVRPLPRAFAANSADRGNDGFTVSGTLTAYTFEADATTFQAPVTCTALTVTGTESTTVLSGALRTGSGALLTGGPLTATGNVTLGPNASGGDFFPLGAIVMWSGEPGAIPEGWALCNGGNGTPDLRDRFLRGTISSSETGTIGGAKDVTLTADQLPSHTHSFTYRSPSKKDVDLFWVSKKAENEDERAWNGTTTRTPTTSSQSTAATQAHENLPPYYALCFIQRIR